MTRARDLSKLANPEVFSVDSSNNVGLNSLTPDAKLDIVGIVSATEYYGDGSQLTGIIAGATLSASNGTQRLVVTSQTTGSMTQAATNSDITYATSTNTLSATQFSGTLLGNATGLQGTPSITVQDITAETVSVAGTVSYEDVDNVNSVGIITANKGIVVPNYGIVVTGVVTATTVSATDVNSTNVNATTVTATSFDGSVSGAVSGSWTLGADGINNYTFTGPGLTGAENDPTIYLSRGQKYNFVNSMNAHPFRIQVDPNGSAGTQYNDGITGNDVSNGTLVWDVQFDAPDTLYYQCTAHPNMGGIIYIGDNIRSLTNIPKSSGYTLIKSDTNKLINMTSSGSVTVPSSIFSVGDLITIYNNNSSSMQIIEGGGTTMRKAGTSLTGNYNIEQYGSVSILCVVSNVFLVSGNIA